MKIVTSFFVFLRSLLGFFGFGQGNCLYFPTCSDVLNTNIEESGLVNTIPLFFKRVIMCNPIYRKFGKKWQ